MPSSEVTCIRADSHGPDPKCLADFTQPRAGAVETAGMQIKTLSLVFLGACAVVPGSTGGGDDDGGGGGGSSMGSGSDGSGGSAGDWLAIPLVDDDGVSRAGNDLVSGLYFTAPDNGYAVTQGAGESFSDGGAVFSIGSNNAKLSFSGKDGGPSQLGGIDFTGSRRPRPASSRWRTRPTSCAATRTAMSRSRRTATSAASSRSSVSRRPTPRDDHSRHRRGQHGDDRRRPERDVRGPVGAERDAANSDRPAARHVPGRSARHGRAGDARVGVYR